jgi:hypothetical protein
MKPTLKATGTKCLKLKHDERLSSSGFKFSWRRYSGVPQGRIVMGLFGKDVPKTAGLAAVSAPVLIASRRRRSCQTTLCGVIIP